MEKMELFNGKSCFGEAGASLVLDARGIAQRLLASFGRLCIPELLSNGCTGAPVWKAGHILGWLNLPCPPPNLSPVGERKQAKRSMSAVRTTKS